MMRDDINQQPPGSMAGSHEGQVLVIVAIASLILLGCAALAVDAGMALSERRGAQNAADAASMAAAHGMVAGASEAELRQTAVDYAESNGFEIEDPAADIRFLDEDGDSFNETVEVDVRAEAPRIFLGAFYEGDWAVGTNATATMTQVEEPFAMIALGEDPSCHPSTGLRFSGNSNINVTGGSVGSNSCVRVDGGALDGLIDGNIEALHGINDSGDRLQTTEGYEKRERSTPIDDPFSHWDEPSCSASGEVNNDPHYSGPGQGHILGPGRYDSFPNSRRLSLLPGIYCIEDRVTIGSNLIARSVDASYEDDGNVGAGGGVLLLATGASGEIRFNGQGSLQIRALSYYDPNFPGCTNACEENAAIWITQSSCTDFDAKGGSESFTRGVIYAPCSGVEIGGNPDTEVLEGMIVADTVRLHGNATINLVNDQDPIEASPEIFLIR